MQILPRCTLRLSVAAWILRVSATALSRLLRPRMTKQGAPLTTPLCSNTRELNPGKPVSHLCSKRFQRLVNSHERKSMATTKLLSDAEVEKIPAVKAVFDDIRATRKSDFVNNFWRGLANDPGGAEADLGDSSRW